MSDWNDIENLWRSNEPPELGDLGRRLNRRTRFLRWWFGIELVMGAIAAVFGVFIIAVMDDWLIGAAVIAFAAYATWHSSRSWRDALSVETGTPAETIASALRRNDALRRYLRTSYLISLACAALIVLMITTGGLGPLDDYAAARRALISTASGFTVLIAWLVGCGFYAERLSRERERLLTLARELGVPT